MSSAVTQRVSPETPPSSDRMLNLMAWLEIHRFKLLAGLVALLVIFGAAYLMRHFKAQREAEANSALLSLRALPDDPDALPRASDYLRVAEAHPSTSAAPRARLLAAAAFFREGQYSEALAEFETARKTISDPILSAQAAYGAAASLDALNRTDEALAGYQEVIRQFPNDSVAGQARLALARIHEARNEPEAALRIYDEVLRDPETGPFSQLATSRRELLTRKHPELVPTNSVSEVTPSAVPSPVLP